MPFQVQHQVDLPTDTLLRAKLVDLVAEDIAYTDKKTGELKSFSKLNWTFEITQQGDFFGKQVRARTSAFLSDSPMNQFRNWAQALLQRDLQMGQVLAESDLVGLSALVTINYEEDRKDSSKKWPRVEDVMALSDAFVPGTEAPF